MTRRTVQEGGGMVPRPWPIQEAGRASSRAPEGRNQPVVGSSLPVALRSSVAGDLRDGPPRSSGVFHAGWKCNGRGTACNGRRTASVLTRPLAPIGSVTAHQPDCLRHLHSRNRRWGKNPHAHLEALYGHGSAYRPWCTSMVQVQTAARSPLPFRVPGLRAGT
jgi:hypothetical protein